MWEKLKEIITDGFPEGYEGGIKSVEKDCSDQTPERAELMRDCSSVSWHGGMQLLLAQQ